MRHTSFLALALTLSVGLFGCPTDNPVECRDQSSCDLGAGGACLVAPSGNQWCAYPDSSCPSGMRYSDQRVGDGLSGSCVTEDPGADAGVDAADPDARPDAPTIDASVDAPIVGPIVTNNQLADLVIGQTNFVSEADRGYTGQSAVSNDVAASAGGVWVFDVGKGRVLGFSPLPNTGDPTASGIVGRPAVTDNTATGAASATNLGSIIGAVGYGGGVLAVADGDRNRVLIWNPAPTAPGEAADIVIGQPNMTSSASGNGASQMSLPLSVWTDGVRLIVGDRANYRVLIWNTMPTANGQAADIVLGQANFGVNVNPSSPSASNMTMPSGITYDGARLYVADSFFNRVLVWDGLPTANNEAADFVLGQPTLTSGSSLAASPTTLNQPTGVARYGNALLVSDYGNDRIVIYQPLPTTSGSSASLVLGQADLNTPAISGPNAATQQGFDRPDGLSVTGSLLFVADSGNRRVVRFTLAN